MIRVSILVFTFIFLCFYKIGPIFAQEVEKFETNYNIVYSVFENGITGVTENVSLKNKTDDFRASEFSLELVAADVRNVQASDLDGRLEPKIEKKGDKTKITLSFNSVVIGKDRNLPFKIYYETSDFVKHNGLTWEINIPGVSDKSGIGDYNVTLAAPASFGKVGFIKPAKNSQTLTWNKSDLVRGGIIVVYGEFQIYDMNLKYHLKNPRLYPVKTRIALPPTTSYQDIFIQNLNPAPLDVDIDSDGNWLATYFLAPAKTLDIEAQIRAQVFLSPKKTDINLTQQEYQTYLLEHSYWEVNDKSIKEQSNKLKTAREIYNFVVGNLTYSEDRAKTGLDRLGASHVLANKTSAVCMEFTDLFIALARSSGIAAREVDGYAYTQDESLRPLSLVRDVLHAWPEYFSKEEQNWIMVDPTWENTTGGLDYFNVLDFNHIAFAIKGADSQYPIAAGGYKIGNVDSKDVEVKFGTLEDITPQENLKIDLEIPQKISSFLPIKAKLTVKNAGNYLVSSQVINIKSADLAPYKEEIKIGAIPPMGEETKEISFNKNWQLGNKKVIIQVVSASGTQNFETLVSPFEISNNKFLLLGRIIGGVLFIILFTKLAKIGWRLYFSRQGGENSLRRKSDQSKK